MKRLINIPEVHIDLLDHSSISDITKVVYKDYFIIDLANFTSSGYSVRILVFSRSKSDYDQLHNYKKLMDAAADPHAHDWLLKKGDRFFFLVSDGVAENLKYS